MFHSQKLSKTPTAEGMRMKSVYIKRFGIINIPNQKRRNQSSSGEKKNYVIKKSNDKLKSKNETNLNTKENTQREV
jgi:hypothetical protein